MLGQTTEPHGIMSRKAVRAQRSEHGAACYYCLSAKLLGHGYGFYDRHRFSCVGFVADRIYCIDVLF